MLSIAHGLEKFHYCAYGRHVTDHKPLEAIFKKHLSNAPLRIVRMMLEIQKYDVDIKFVEMVKSGAPCQHNAKMNTKEPMTPHDVPPKPWHTLGSDLFFWNNGSYLIIDYYSKFPVVRKLHDVTSITVIKHMKSIFEEYGISEKLVTGHDTQFTSSTFGDFSRTYGLSTPPRIPTIHKPTDS